MFSSKTSNFDRLLDKATSKLLLEPEWEAIMQICDILRQGDIQPSQALISIRKKIDCDNYHTCNYGLLVLESVVKNCGSTLHSAVATKEFMIYMHQLATKKQDSLKNKVLELIQVWSHAFRANSSFKIIQETYNSMKAEGFVFPALKESDAMFASEKAPDWMDGEHCHKCVSQFTTFNRKHHCRACGQVFCQKCSSKNSIIPKFGIEKEVRVCDPCWDSINKGGVVKKEGEEDELPIEYLNSALAKQPQVPATKTEAEVQEEEELQLALALSQSEAEAKKNKVVTDNTTTSKHNKADSIYSLPHKPQQQQQPSMMDTSDMDPELARYLNRNYWQQKSFEMKTTHPSAPTATASTLSSAATTAAPASATSTAATSLKKIGVVTTQQQQQSISNVEEEDQERAQFLSALSGSIEIFMNRMKSNSQRHRSISNDSSVQSLFMTLTAMHPTLLNYIQQLETSRAHFEGLQDKLGQLKDARDALDVLREEHREKERRRQEEAEKLRQVQLVQKLEVLRQQKQVYLEYQRQMALQRMHEQEQQMQQRLEQQKQQHELKAKQYAYPQAYQNIPSYQPSQPVYNYPTPHGYSLTYPSNQQPLSQMQPPQQQMQQTQQMQQPPQQLQQQPQHQQQSSMDLPQPQFQQPTSYPQSNGYDNYVQQQPPHQQQQQQPPQQLPPQQLLQQQQPHQQPQQQPQQQPSHQPPPQQQIPQQQPPQQQPPQQQPPQQQTYPAFNPNYQTNYQTKQEPSQAYSNMPATTTTITPQQPTAELINFD